MTRLTTYSPAIYRNNLFDLVDRFFHEQGQTQTTPKQGIDFVPRVDIYEQKDAYHLHVMVPGVAKEDIKISIEGGLLNISGERKRITESDDVKLHRIESAYGKFERNFKLPEGVNEEELTARYENGLLMISLAKADKKVAKEIQIL